ncbi:hypothetical protein [Oculatella sp. LEGE 06141]|uniref:hypothetical protein n=1 Tax=Oculatella sp. LEGE 06141 TaxID=1828648 RepID=UPI001D13D98D|nr:hypothetical protein [Oculatella sp. LEGE 06141]
MLQLEDKQNVEAERLKRAFFQVLVQVSQAILQDLTRAPVLTVAPAILHLARLYPFEIEVILDSVWIKLRF